MRVPPVWEETRIVLGVDEGRGTVSTIRVDQHVVGYAVFGEDRGNRVVYLRSALRAREVRQGGAPVILDAAPRVPYEHVLGVLNACREAGIAKVEFAAPPAPWGR